MRLSARASKGRKFLFKVALDALDGLVSMHKLLAGTRKKRTRGGFFMRNGDMDGSRIPFGYHNCINLMYSDSEVFEFILLVQAFCTNCVSISENV